MVAAGVALSACLVGVPGAAAAPPTATLGLSKQAFRSGTNDPLTDPVTPGGSFDYQLSASCSGLTQGCISAKTVDVLPLDIVFNGSDPSPLYTVVYDAATRTVTTTYADVLPAPPNPPGSRGIPAGSTRTAVLHVTLSATSTVPNGSTITNTATTTADNADAMTDSAPITVSVPRAVRPVAGKTISPSQLIAQSGAQTTATLSVRNASSPTAQVTALTVADTSKATWDSFDLTSLGPVTEFPAGADEVSVQYCTAPAPCTAAQFVAGPFVPGPALSLPADVDPATVTGVQFVFRNAGGTGLPVSTTAGTVPLGLTLRDTVRSTGAALDPQTTLTQQNCASPSAVDAVTGPVTGSDACVPFGILPGRASVRMSKDFFPDSTGSYTRNGYAVAGQRSGATALVRAENDSAIPVTNLTITEPSTSIPSGGLTALDVTQLRLQFPTGATAATGTITCADGTTQPISATVTGTVDVTCPAASPPTAVTVTYAGTIPPRAAGQLGLHGTLNAAATGGSTLSDCADGAITAGQSSATGTACAQLPVENPRTTVGGVKNSSSPQTGGALVRGFPVTFTVQATNSGNLPQGSFTLTDPPASTAAADNPFTVVSLTTAALSTSPPSLASQFQLQVTRDNGATWVAYDPAADPTTVDGIRAQLQTGTVAPTNEVTIRFGAQLRDTVPDGTTLRNCQTTTVASVAGTGTSGSVCASTLTAAPPSTAGQVTKLIQPATLPAPIPGLTPTAQVQLRAQNTGNVPLRRIVITDPDPGQLNPDAFFERVNVTGGIAVNFPPGADRVQIDACLSAAACLAGTYTLGPPTGSSSPTLPAGVDPATVAGIRATFTNSSGGFTLIPGANFPNSGPCVNATLCVTVTPRTTERTTSAPITFPESFSDIATAGGESPLSNGNVVSFGSAPAPLDVTPGTPQLRADKTADAKDATTVSPGQPIAYTLATTNAGTAAVPGLSVVEPLPAGLNFDNTFNGDNGLPFRITATVPAGTPEPPTPAFTALTDPVTNRITELRWQYPGSFAFYPTSRITISFQARLDPTVPAGTRIDNTYGASTTDATVRAALTCATGAPSPTLGCTDGASATAGTGSAVDAQKWVHGDDSRGFYNTRTAAFVPIGDPSCPLLVVGGNDYTRFPCIALVLAGQDFTFLLNLTNVGTTPITETRLVDYLPKLGDRGVVVNGARETEWDPRPVLAAAPALATGSPGTLDLAYSATSPTCTTDIARPPVACSAGTWGPAFSADAEAFRGFVTFPTPLPPAGTTRIVVPMSAPANLDTTTNPLPIAWNSFAHSDFFRQPNGTITQLPPVEPEKVGVALPFGNLRVDKTVTGPIPPGSIIGPFRGTYSCVVTTAGGTPVLVASGIAEFAPDAPFTVSHVPAGAVCTVEETDTGGGNVTPPAPVIITQDLDGTLPTVATITNDFPAPRLLVTKALAGDAARYAVGPFTITVDCTLAGQPLPARTLTFTADGTHSITDLPIGAQCTIAEPDTRGATSAATTYSSGDHATISALLDAVATLTNTYDAAPLTVTKQVSGPGPAGPYTFTASCTLTSNTGTKITVPLTPADATFALSTGQRRVIAVPKGAACKVTELKPPAHASVTYNGAATSPTLTVTDATTLSIVNTYQPATPAHTATSSTAGGPAAGSNGGGGAGPGGSSGGSGLAFTGSDVLGPLATAAVLITAGLGLWWTGRRRTQRRAH